MATAQTTDAELLESLNAILADGDSDGELEVATSGSPSKTAKHAKETKATAKAALSAEQLAEKRLAAQRMAKRNKTALKKLNIALKGRGLNFDEFISEDDSFADTVDKAINDMIKSENLASEHDVMLVNTRIFPDKVSTSELLQSILAFLTGAEAAQHDGKLLKGAAATATEIKMEQEAVDKNDTMSVSQPKKRKAPQGKKAKKIDGALDDQTTEPAAPVEPAPPTDLPPSAAEQGQPLAEPMKIKIKKPRAKKQQGASTEGEAMQQQQ